MSQEEVRTAGMITVREAAVRAAAIEKLLPSIFHRVRPGQDRLQNRAILARPDRPDIRALRHHPHGLLLRQRQAVDLLLPILGQEGAEVAAVVRNYCEGRINIV